MGKCKDQDLLVEMLTLPTKQIFIEVYLSLNDCNEGHKVLELEHTILPLEEKLQGSLAFLLQLFIDDGRIPSGKQTGIIDQEAFNSLVVHEAEVELS